MGFANAIFRSANESGFSSFLPPIKIWQVAAHCSTSLRRAAVKSFDLRGYRLRSHVIDVGVLIRFLQNAFPSNYEAPFFYCI